MGSNCADSVALSVPGQRLVGRERNDFTQYGEDGLIEAALEIFGQKNSWCFEVGAADGEFYSNTLRLRNMGWNAVLIEAGDDQFSKLKRFESHAVHVVQETIGRDSLDRILSEAGAAKRPDLGVIDIDGQDYWAWEGMKTHRPRLMLVEFFPHYESPIPEIGGEGQASMEPILQLGKEKGYTPLVSTYVNVLFLADEEL